MRLSAFLKDKILLILLQLVCMILLAGFLYLTGYPSSLCRLILIVWSLILGVWLLISWVQRRSYFKKTEQLLSQLDRRYLLGELLPDSWRLEDKLYRDMIRKSNKSVIERIHAIEEEKKAYKEYIESWVHEIKVPITGISSICENHRKDGGEEVRTIALENQKIENYVDMALYYARSEDVYKDYMIRETLLSDVVYGVLAKNRHYLISNHVQAEVDCPDYAYTDRKWIEFILNQMILNSVKYRSEQPLLKIYTQNKEKSILLTLEDNGVGIRQEELPRIFEKGFTGSNGRTHGQATGMGLYLCRKLCDKLGVGLRAESALGSGTKMILEFPISTYLSKLLDNCK